MTIIDELTRLNRKYWLNPLQHIINTYKDYTLNTEDAPQYEIENILQQLKSNDSQLDLVAIFALESLNCFEYRAYSHDNNESHYWNPLDESYTEFKKKYGNIEHYQHDTPHPSSDILRRWFAKKLQYRQVLQAKADYTSTIALLK